MTTILRSGSNAVPTPRRGAAVRLQPSDIHSVLANELPIAVNRSPSLSAEERGRVLRSGLWINLFAATTLGFAFGLALWVWVTGRWETLAVTLSIAVSLTFGTFIIVATSARWLVRWFPSTSPVCLAAVVRGLIAYAMSLPVVGALPSLLGPGVMPRSIAQTYPYLGGVVILIAVTSLGLYSRLQAEVAERKKAAMDLEAALDELGSTREQLIRSSKLAAIGELVSGVAHEINNPLAGISGHTQLLLRRDLDATVKESLELIYGETQRVTRIVQNLLSFAREQPPEDLPLSVNETVTRTLEMRSYELRLDNIELVTDLDPANPAVFGDLQQLQQVFLNIVNNAQQAMATAHGRGRLEVKSRRAKGNVRVTFTDDGPGMPADVIDRVFDPFFTTKEVGKGTGLGLSICYGIVKEHGGTISVESPHGKGSTFTVELPLAKVAPPGGSWEKRDQASDGEPR